MSYSLNSLNGGYIADHIGEYNRVVKGNARSLEDSSHKALEGSGAEHGSCYGLERLDTEWVQSASRWSFRI